MYSNEMLLKLNCKLQVSAFGPVNDQLMTSAILRTAYDLLLCSTFHEFAFVVET